MMDDELIYEIAGEQFPCPICRRGTVDVAHKHVIRKKWLAECDHCGLQAEVWTPEEAKDYFEELAVYFEKELKILTDQGRQ